MAKKKVFDGRLIKVFTDRKKLPGGKKHDFEEVHHPGAALILCFVSGKIVLIRQYRAVIGRYIWELPAGTLAINETPYSCAKREITEETGYIAGKLEKIGVIYTSPGFCTEKIHIFKATCTGKGPHDRGEDELIKVRLFSKKEVSGLFARGKITDSKTISALAFAKIL